MSKSKIVQDEAARNDLQEQADPDVLKAKQAATGQFSATNNLDKDHQSPEASGSAALSQSSKHS